MPTPRCQLLTMDERKAKLAELVDRFAREKEFYKSKQFNEANARLNFIDPFLELLGWDVKNEEGKTESFKNVKIETNQLQGGNVKHPDYALRLGMGQTILYVEAKQPSINLKENPEPALQVRRYGYTSKLKLSILTDFDEFCVYDTTIRPKPTDKVGVARIEYYTFDQYLDNFESIYNRYSYDACNSGKMTFYAENSSNKKGTSTIDDDILQMIEEWRLLLANDIALNNSEIDEYDLTSVVQKIIDRIIFLRICEDKNVEPYGTLKQLGTKNGDSEIFARMKTLFRNANEKYNAGLFAKDDFLDAISLSDKTLTKIIKQLYYPECPYEFSVLPVEILGTIYERFLGKIIQFNRKTKNGHNIVVIEKPEVQKAGGVYYTPRYIVQYIVEQTIGQKIAGKTPDQIAIMRFVDPACGSGSFLVGAYDFLLRFHLDYKQASNLKKAEKAGIVYRDAATGEYKLSVAEKKRILVNNIYGVDLDLQATEVSKVSLFLKLLEDEGLSVGEMFKQSELATQKILPSMEGNIKCGNSLVGTDFVKPELFESKMEYVKVRPFNWEKEFAEVFANEGFDCVIGNPPYMRVQTIAEFHPKIKEYYETHYTNSTKGSYDLANVFLEKEFKLLKSDGIGGIIFPHKFLNTDNGIEFRNFLMKEKRIFKLAHFGADMVFENADTYTCIPIFNGKQNEGIEFQRFAFKSDFKTDLFDQSKYSFLSYKDIEKAYSLYGKNMWILFDHSKGFDIFEKMYKNSKLIKDVFSEFFQGIATGLDKFFIVEKLEDGSFEVPLTGKKYNLEPDLFKPFLMGKEVHRYCELKPKNFVFFPYIIKNGVASIITLKDLQKNYPKTFEYVKDHEKELKGREHGKYYNVENWHMFSRPQNLTKFEQPKLTSMEICANHPNVTLNRNNIYHSTTSYSWVKKPEVTESYEYFLGIANSNLMWWFLKTTGDTLQGDARRFKTAYLNPFPLKTPTKEQHDSISSLVSQMLATQEQLQGVLSASDRQFLEQKVAMLEQRIDAEVYSLYGLTEEEIAVVSS